MATTAQVTALAALGGAIQGAIGGALGGAIPGAVAAGEGKRWKGAAVGALVGGMQGALVGALVSAYWTTGYIGTGDTERDRQAAAYPTGARLYPPTHSVIDSVPEEEMYRIWALIEATKLPEAADNLGKQYTSEGKKNAGAAFMRRGEELRAGKVLYARPARGMGEVIDAEFIED
jgi:hypothetical protein